MDRSRLRKRLARWLTVWSCRRFLRSTMFFMWVYFVPILMVLRRGRRSISLRSLWGAVRWCIHLRFWIVVLRCGMGRLWNRFSFSGQGRRNLEQHGSLSRSSTIISGAPWGQGGSYRGGGWYGCNVPTVVGRAGDGGDSGDQQRRGRQYKGGTQTLCETSSEAGVVQRLCF